MTVDIIGHFWDALVLTTKMEQNNTEKQNYNNEIPTYTHEHNYNRFAHANNLTILT